MTQPHCVGARLPRLNALRIIVERNQAQRDRPSRFGSVAQVPTGRRKSMILLDFMLAEGGESTAGFAQGPRGPETPWHEWVPATEGVRDPSARYSSLEHLPKTKRLIPPQLPTGDSATHCFLKPEKILGEPELASAQGQNGFVFRLSKSPRSSAAKVHSPNADS